MTAPRRRRLGPTPLRADSTVLLPRHERGPLRSVLRRLGLGLGVLTAVALLVWLGREGYRDSTDDGSVDLLDAFYYATVSVTTTGYGDIVPASDSARLLNILVVTPLRIVFLIILVGTTLEVLTERSREQFRQTRWRSTLHSHTVVVGYGTKGRSAVRALTEDGLDPEQVVVVDPDERRAAEATADGLAVVRGDATRAQVLELAGIAAAATVVVSVPRDDTAVLVALTARAANPGARLVVAVREAENAPLLRHSGADEVVVSAEAAGRLLGVAAASPVTGAVLTDLLEPGHGLEIVTRQVRADEIGGGGRDVADAVLAVRRDGRTLPYTAPEVEPLREGDVLVVVRSA